jgi:hypothetical protein
MKRMLMLAAGFVISLAGFSQLSYGIQGSGNISSASLSFKDGPDWSRKMNVGPGGGIVLQYGFGENFALRTGAGYLQHAVTVNTSGVDPDNGELGEIKIEAKNKFNYVQIPLYALYTKPISSSQFFIGAGPFLNYGLSGKSKLVARYVLPNGEPGQEELEADAFKKEEEDGANFQRTDLGLGAVAGIRLGGGFFVQAGYQLGLSNITRDEGNKYRTQGIQFSIGYFFK